MSSYRRLMSHLKLAPPYTVRAYRNRESGQIEVEPRFKKGRHVAFKIWEKRAQAAIAELKKREAEEAH